MVLQESGLKCAVLSGVCTASSHLQLLSHFLTNVLIVSSPAHGQHSGSDGSRPILIQVAESIYRFTLGSVAGGKSHAPLAPYIPSPHHPPIHPPTCLPAYLPPPALCCPHKKRVRENGQWPLYCPFLTRATVTLLLKEKCSLSSLFSLCLSLSPTLAQSRSVLSHASLGAMGKPSCAFFCTFVSDEKTDVTVGVKGGAQVLCLAPDTPLFFLLPSFIPPLSSSSFPKGDSLIRRYGSIISSSSFSVSL